LWKLTWLYRGREKEPLSWRATAAAEMGGILLPPVPAYYNLPKTVDNIINQSVGKALDQFGLKHNLFQRWEGKIFGGAKEGKKIIDLEITNIVKNREVLWMNLREETIESREIYKGKVIRVLIEKVRLPDGRESMREIVEHGGAVAIVPVDDDNGVYFVRQYRKPLDKILLEIPAGRLEPGEDPADCAKRELAEEIGFAPGELRQMAFLYSSPGFSSEKIYLYLARNLVRHRLENDEGEFLEVERIPLAEALKMVTDGTVEDGKTITGILLAAHFLSL